MLIEQKKSKFNWKTTLLGATISLYLLIALGLLTGFVRLKSAYAQGSAYLLPPDDQTYQVVFVSAETDDPRRTIDPGWNKHVGSCSARIKGSVLILAVFNAYPGYTCTLETHIANQGNQPVTLHKIVYEVPEGITITGAQAPPAQIIQPGEQTSQIFSLQVEPQAEENASYRFAIYEFFGPAEP